MSIFAFIVLHLTVLVLSHPQYEYGMVIDAGSTHSQLYIYKWKYRETKTSLAPRSFPTEYAESDSSEPGISTCCTSYQEMELYLNNFFKFCKTTLKKQEKYWSSYPIYLKATAGMRILSISKRELLLHWIDEVFSNETLNPFLYNSNQAIIIAGEEEGLFGWMTVNYAKNVLSTIIDNENTQTTPLRSYGALDMGGQSLQISFVPKTSSNILQAFFTLQLWQNNYRIYTHSYLTYGSSGVESKLAQSSYDYFVDKSLDVNNQTIYNPCLFEGYNKAYNITNYLGQPQMITQIANNTDYVDLCEKFMKKLLYNDTLCVTGEGSCAVNGVYQPAIPTNITFYAFSTFYYSTIPMGLADDVSLFEIGEVIDDIKSLSYAEFKNTSYGVSLQETGQWKNYAYNKLFNLIYMYEILGKAFRFPINNTNIIYANKINGTSLGWTGGSIIRDVNWQYYTLSKSNHNNQAYRTSTIVLGVLCGILLVAMAVMTYKMYATQTSIGNDYQAVNVQLADN